ncbi:MAG: cytochrome c maturation protein CcmE [Calditrichaeota bacterium]|nr:cytochrome c maturation protein CcmE [Calditrichota bacterium]
MKRKFVIGIVVLVSAFGFLFFQGLDQSMMAYVNVQDLETHPQQHTNKVIQVTGIVQPGSVQLVAAEQTYYFVLQDLEDPRSQIRIVYRGIVPDNFKPGIQVVVQGQFQQDRGLIQAERILVKCPSKYEEDA